MDDGILPRSILLLALIVAGGFFAAAETAYAYCNRIRFKLRADDGERSARRVCRIIDNYDRTITTLLVMINVIHIAAASISTVLAVGLIGPGGTIVSTIVMTLLVFFFSEMLPKTVARANADVIASAFSVPILGFTYLLWPLAWFFGALGELAKKLVGSEEKAPTLTEQEFHTLVENSEEEGAIEPEDSELIQSAINFSDTLVSQIMTPVEKMVSIDIHDSSEAQLACIMNRKYSRIPVTDRGRIIGILHVRKYLRRCLSGSVPSIRPLLAPPTFVRAETPVNTLFDDMRRKKLHMCIVTGDSSVPVGIVTMEDILEELVGDIADEDDPVEEGGEAL